MDRLTRNINGKWVATYGQQKVQDRLAAYEDNGQTPEEQAAMIADNARLRAEMEAYSDTGYAPAEIKMLEDSFIRTMERDYAEIEQLRAELAESRRRERAAVEGIKETFHIVEDTSNIDFYDEAICGYCMHNNPDDDSDFCESCGKATNFKWRGAEKEG